jgi:hypothetical protein
MLRRVHPIIGLIFIRTIYQDAVAIYAIETVELISGALPSRQRRLVEAWAELHREELMANWELLQRGRPPRKIEPLR